MKTLRTTIGMLALLLVLLAAGCSNPLNRFLTGEGAEGGDGTLSVTLSVPNYQDHSASEPAARAISPDSRYMEIYIYDGVLETDRPGGPVWNGELYWDHETSAANGFFYTVYESSFGVAEGTYDHLEVILYDANGGSVLTTGSASAVTVNGGAENRISVTLTPPDGMFTDLTVGGAAVAGTVANRSMDFYRFTATAGTSYDVTITPSTGKPDVYLFDPDGVRPGTVLATAETSYVGDYLQTEGTPLTMTTYAVDQGGTYYLGVYGWEDPYDGSYSVSDYDISVAAAASPVARPSDPAPPAVGTVGYYVDEAIAALDEERYNDALTEFTNALLVADAESDPEYGVAFAGYNALYLMTGLTHPDVVTVARENLGLADYPTDMDALLSGSWLQSYVNSYDNQYFVPRIIGQSDLDGDGLVDGYERGVAAMEYFVTNNAGFADVANPALAVLESRLDSALQQIDAMGPDQLMTFTWNMVYDDLDEIVSYFSYQDSSADYAWPVDEHGNPIDVVVGKADLRLLAATGQMLKMFIHQGQVYDLNLTQALLQDYYDDFNPETGTAFDDPPAYTSDSPFSTGFLGATADATTHLAEAKSAFLAAAGNVEAALYEIATGRAATGEALLLSPASPVDGIADGWADIASGMSLAVEEIIPRVEDSAINGTTMYFPFALVTGDAMPEDYRYGAWPEEMDLQTDPTIGMNFGRLFSAPFSGVLELGADGEPVWYTASAGPLTFSESAPITDPDSHGMVYVRIPDATFGGLVPIDDTAYIPMDDPATRYDIYRLDYSDTNGNYFWDPGETISYVEYMPDIEGIINTRIQNVSLDYPGGDPLAYYETVPTAGDVSDQAFVDAGYAADLTDAAALKSAIAADPGLDEYWMSADEMGALPAYLVGNSLYLSMPAMLAWHSYAAANTSYVDSDGYTHYSTGTVWTALPEELD